VCGSTKQKTEQKRNLQSKSGNKINNTTPKRVTQLSKRKKIVKRGCSGGEGGLREKGRRKNL